MSASTSDPTAPRDAAATLLSFGHGYSAQALTRRLLPLGWTIIGTTRSDERAAALAQSGVTPRLWPGSDLSDALADATHILVSAAPDAEGDPVLAGWRAEIAARAPDLQWVGYLSTTGVYGDHQGGWVDETTALTPATQRGRWRKQAEADWQALARDSGRHCISSASPGFTAPGAAPFAKVRAGTARRIIKPGQVFSRIHVEDIAQVLAASIARPRPGAVYNVCDDDPAPPQEVIAHAATLLGLPLPAAVAYDQAEMTPMARSFYAESKRVRNDRIKTELGVTLRYPDYRAGLAALLAETTA